jgi:hypothetical protein
MYKTFETGCDKSLPKVFLVARTGIEPVLFFDLALISTFLRFF